MNVEHPLMPMEGHDPHRHLPGAPLASQEPVEVTPLDRVMALMRGRWVPAIVLGCLLGALGGIGGFFAVKPVYLSQGLIRVEPVEPQVLFPLDQQLHNYSQHVASQAQLLAAQGNLNRAWERPQWAELRAEGRQLPTRAEYIRELRADHPRSSELIVVSYQHPDPRVAQTAVQTAIDAYVAAHDATRQRDQRLNVLRERISELRSRRDTLRDRRRAIGRDYGTDNLSAHYRQKLEEGHRYASRMREIELVLAAAGVEPPAAEPLVQNAQLSGANNVADELVEDFAVEADDADAQAEQLAEAEELSVQEIAAMDPQMRDYLEQRRRLRERMREQGLSLGDGHREVRRSAELLAAIEETIEERAAEFRDRYHAGLIAGDLGDGANIDELRRRYALLRDAHSRAQEEAMEIGQLNMEIQGIRDQEEVVEADLRTAVQRREAIETESRVAGRIRAFEADQPLEPERDRRALAAVVGTTFGGGLGFAIVLGIAFFDRRFRSIQDASDTLGQITMLGILPRLPDDLADPEQAAIASHCVHQIRTLLQIGPDSTGRRVFSLTSPGAGDGKTSLTLALGLSFAKAGAKTLIVDFDLGRGGLTERVNAIIRRKIGQILQRQHLVTEQQVEQALRVAQESDRRLGEVLVELGYVTAEDLEEALSLQEQMPVGLLDALSGEPIEQCVAETGIHDLSILPIGSAMPDDVARLSPLTIRKLLEEARQQFDVILVDTGPVPASLDASHVAVESDGVVMVVSRGEQRAQAEKSLDYLMSIDARIAGVVFNRAEGRDLDLLGEGSGDDSLTRRRSGRFAVEPAAAHSRFGPVARAVAGTASGARANGHTNGRPPTAQ